MDNETWVKLYRKLINTDLMRDPPALQLFIYLLLRAAHKPHTVEKHQQKVDLLPGQCIFGRKSAAQTLGRSEKQIRVVLKRLKRANRISVKRANKFSIISIINWDTYQGESDEKGQQKTDQKGQQKKGPRGARFLDREMDRERANKKETFSPLNTSACEDGKNEKGQVKGQQKGQQKGHIQECFYKNEKQEKRESLQDMNRAPLEGGPSGDSEKQVGMEGGSPGVTGMNRTPGGGEMERPLRELSEYHREKAMVRDLPRAVQELSWPVGTFLDYASQVERDKLYAELDDANSFSAYCWNILCVPPSIVQCLRAGAEQCKVERATMLEAVLAGLPTMPETDRRQLQKILAGVSPAFAEAVGGAEEVPT